MQSPSGLTQMYRSIIGMPGNSNYDLLGHTPQAFNVRCAFTTAGRKSILRFPPNRAKLATEHGLNVQAIAVDDGHNSAEDAEIKMAIDFFHPAQ